MISNIYNNLLSNNQIFESNIEIKKIDINNNYEIFDNAYQIAANSFLKELTQTLESEILCLYGKQNIIILKYHVEIPFYYNKKISQNSPIFFKKNIFLQNYEFVKKIKKYYSELNLSIEFWKINKYTWEKIVTNTC